jgi:hypothetical protein
MTMERYKNLGGDSGVVSYGIGVDFIKVSFKTTPKIYVYTHTKPGQNHVDKMKALAIAGHGLQTYINQHRSAGYSHTEP